MEELKALCSKGDRAFKNEQFLQAISFYSDALMLSPQDEGILGCRSAVYAKLGMFNESKKDAESLISIIPQEPKGHFLRAVSLENLGNYRECLRSYLKAYELDPAHPTELLLSIVGAVGCICQMSEMEEISLSDQGASFQNFESFVQLGKRLHETENYKICISVIMTALKAHYGWDEQLLYSQASIKHQHGEKDFEKTNKDMQSHNHVSNKFDSEVPHSGNGFASIYVVTGGNGTEEKESREDSQGSLQNGRVVMLALLVMSEAHYCLYQYSNALSVSQKCLSVALDFKEKEFEIKCYVKIANIHRRLAQYVQAVSYNGKLLAVGRDLQRSGEDKEKFQKYWNSDIERRAVWNLSAAYKLMGDYKKALHHAQEYMEVLKFTDQENLTTAYSNLGELELLQGNYEKSLECHKIELQLCKKFNDRHGAAYAFGNIGIVYANIGNFHSATVNHEQHLKLAQNLNDKVSEVIALRNFGCLYKLMGEHAKALGYFEQHLQLSRLNKMEELQCKAYGLVGACFKDLHQLRHAQYYYDTCLKLAVEQNDVEEELECNLALAQISKAMRKFETSRQYFNKAIPVLEDKLLSKCGNMLIYKDLLLEKLDQCYRDLQEALIEMNLEEEALEIAEHCRSRILVGIIRRKKILANSEALSTPGQQLVTAYSAKDIISIIDSQQATLLFFSVIPTGFLLWVLSPGKGITICHWHKSCDHSTFANKIKHCIEEFHGTCKEKYYDCDHRALPDSVTRKCSESVDEREGKKFCYHCEFLYSTELTPLQKLYHLLLGPIEDELKIELGSGVNELVIIPDLEANSVPFACLQDKEGKYLHEFFNVRTLPCIRTISQRGEMLPQSSNAEKQVTESSKILVQGNPAISKVDLNGKVWSPRKQSDLAEEEVNIIASLLGVDPISGHHATKEHFLTMLPQASVVHLVTYGSWPDACIALSPNTHHHGDSPSEDAFLVTVSDIAMLKLSAKLVVLNACCGCGHQYCQLKHASFHLAAAFLAAGAQSVIMPLWSAPQATMLNLFCKFYSGLEEGRTLSQSLKEAWTLLRSVEHMSAPDSWASLVHVGFDTTVDFMKLRRQLFDGVLDQVVKSSSSERFPLVTAETLDNKVLSVTFKMKKFQELLTQLLFQHTSVSYVLPALRDLIQLAHQMLLLTHNPEFLLKGDPTMCAQLSSHVLESPFAREFLVFLGFDFQKDGAHEKDPFVVFPHWDPDGTLTMTSQVLQAVSDILKESSSGGYALARITNTLKKNTMEKLKEFLSLSSRYPERIMKTSDFVLRSLWYNPELQQLLASLGFHEVGQSLLFNMTEGNQLLLKSTLAVVTAMLDYIEKGKTQTSSSHRQSLSPGGRPARLASLSPQLTPSKQIVMETPWMSTKSDRSENDLKMVLAKELEGFNKEFAGRVTKSKYWHAHLLRAQSTPGFRLPVIGSKTQDKQPSRKVQPEEKARRVKVQTGMTPSCNRRLVEEEPRLSINATRERRNEIYRIYAQRFDDIAMHKRHKVRQLFMSQIEDRG